VIDDESADRYDQYSSNGSLKVDGLDFKFCISEGVQALG